MHAKGRRSEELLTGNHNESIKGDQAIEIEGTSIPWFFFENNKAVKDGYQDYLNLKGVKKILNGEDASTWLKEEVALTRQWAQSNFKAPIKLKLNVDNHDYDFLTAMYELVVSEKVLIYMKEKHPHDFEAFDVDFINDNSGKKYYILNITNPDFTWAWKGNFKGLKTSIFEAIKWDL